MNDEKQSVWKKAQRPKVKFSLYLPGGQRGRGTDTVPIIVNLGTKWRLVVRFTALSLYLRKEIWYPLYSRTGWAPEPESIFCRRENSRALQGFEPRIT